jgi:CBS domain containing-hemolysin-like protein
MAVVLDRSGGCVGVLTIKDLVEEIVGDLEAW